MMEDRILIGKIVASVGLKGEVKVYSYAEKIQRYEKIEEILTSESSQGETKEIDIYGFKIESVRYKGDTVILKLHGVYDREAADRLKNRYVYMNACDLEPLPEGEYYIRELIGFDVTDQSGEIIGKLENIDANTAQKLYVVRKNNGEMAYIPGVDEFVIKVDKDKKKIEVKVIEGLIDEN